LALAEFLKANPAPGATRAIFGVMGDKPIHDMLRACEGLFKEWNVVELKDVPRAELPSRLIAMIGDEKVVSSGEIVDVWADVAKRSRTGDRVVIFGSFLTVAEGYTVLANQASFGESA
jgi:dihydrofolate synthase/folylpolyglutamate synthase